MTIVPQKGTVPAKGKTTELIFFAPVASFCADNRPAL
jgi:hypothetical protein